MTASETIRKKWIVTFNLNVDGVNPSHVPTYIDGVKQIFPEEVFNEVFETKTLVLYVPTTHKPTGLEIHEVLLDVHGYDKWDVALDDFNQNAKDVLDKLRKIIDGDEE